ncbi:MAG: iron-containing alcohol dehydrogenase [Actinobacteria bacterium]|nr:iron-containing alcohol dehydrogenase [Actinomycetota bacterium]MBU1943242.1 iron-containing alcohol dehydrogenase [Actinomycetota bacterium]MBU2685964.1 iron-containing alcohol dehydrogenase [Actinomycetota bacterium]
MVYGYEFKLPGKVVCREHGAGGLGKPVARMGGTRVLLVTDPGVRNAGLLDPVLSGFGEGGPEVAAIFDGVGQDPDFDTVLHCSEAARRSGADCLIAVGGGSVIDTAKVVLIALQEGDDLTRFRYGEYFPKGPLLPLVAIPTTAGTGSESTHIAMIVDPAETLKVVFHGSGLAPRLALLDASMTLTLPPRLTAATGMDALCHAVESLHSNVAEPVTDGLAVKALELIGGNILRAFHQGDDLEARAGMLVGSNIAGMAAANAYVALIHCLAHAMGARFDVHHGVAVALVLTRGMEHNLRFEGVPAAYRKVARGLGLDVDRDDDQTAACRAIERIRELVADLELPRTLREVGIPRESLEDLAGSAMQDRSFALNPGRTSLEEVLALLEKAY